MRLHSTTLKNLYAIIFVLCTIITTNDSFAQSNNCSTTPGSVVTLPVNTACVPRGFTTRWWWSGATYGSCAAGGAFQDGWFVVYGTGGPVTVSITGSNRDFVLAAFTGCGGVGEVACTYSTTAAGSIVFPTTLATPYYIQINRRSGGGFNTHTGNICATSPTFISNDLPCSAIPLTVGTSCSWTTGVSSPSTDSGVPNPGCGGYFGGDAWYTITVPPTGNVVINTNNISFPNSGMAVYSGTCGALALIECDDDDSNNGNMSAISLTGQTPGNTLWIRVWEKGNNAFGAFDICVMDGPNCGNSTEDWCDAPATLTQGPSNFSSSTYPYYTSDTPGNLNSEFCGTIENNSWYEFTALNTTESFPFTSVNNCINGDGIQAEVYEVTTDLIGCCTGFNSVSNCWNPGTQATGTVTATGLTVGNTYVLMVDGYAGDNCEFTVSNWAATGIILPVELSDLAGTSLPDKNVITWRTITEKDNDYFNVQRSFNGTDFETIGYVLGSGTSTTPLDYRFDDESPRSGDVYYRLEQVDYNGDRYLSNVIALNREMSGSGIVAVYPNPTKKDLTVEVRGSNHGEGLIQLMDSKGQIVRQQATLGGQFNSVRLDVSDLENGVYFVSFTDGETNSIEKIIKH